MFKAIFIRLSEVSENYSVAVFVQSDRGEKNF